MTNHVMSQSEEAVHLTKLTGVLPAIKLKEVRDVRPYVAAMLEGGARVIEITMTTPGVLEAFRAINDEFGQQVYLAAGTCLDAAAAFAAIQAGARVIVSPAVVPEVIATARRYQVACYSGAFTATEVLTAMQAGADMVKIFPAALGGPRYMMNLRMIYPHVNLIPSGGIDQQNAGEFIRCGACAVSGARNFFDQDRVAQHGMGWITQQIRKYIEIVAEAKATAYQLP